MSPKQRRILGLIVGYAVTPGAEWPTIDDLITAGGAGSSKQAMQHTLRDLETAKLIERTYQLREGRVNLVAKPLPEAFRLVEPSPPTGVGGKVIT